MSARPEPPVPPDCDLSGYDWFPLYFRRLQRSDWWLAASDLARSRNVDLWAEAYQQVPAGSLPDSDVVLAKLAGFGRDLEGWRAAKGEIMAPWTLCADGRWYHPVLAEVALEAWRRASVNARRARAGAAARWGRDRTAEATPEAPTPDASSIARSNAPASPEHPPGNARSCHRTETGQDRTGSGEANASPSPAGARPPEGGGAEASWDLVFVALQAAYPEQPGRGSPMAARAAFDVLPADVRLGLPAAAKAYAEARGWGSKGPPALARWLREQFWQPFMPDRSNVNSILWSGPPELRAAVVHEKGETFARSYLDPAEWRVAGSDGRPAIIPLTSTAAVKLRDCDALGGVSIEQPRRRQA